MADEKDGALRGPRVIIIGGGIGGIMSAIGLRRQLGFSSFTIYEQSDDLGGTWNLNRYPGCASDIGTHWYSLSTDLNPDWEQSHVFQPQLKAYWKRLAAKYNINNKVSLFSKVLSAEWDVQRQMYRVEVQDVRSGQTKVDYANAIISAIGLLDTPHYPEDLQGIRDTFKGEHFHSARWDPNVDLHNKRVAVIGNGCSASQFVPVISEDPSTQVINFCRTPNWILPRWRVPISVLQRRVFKYIPFVMRLYRWIMVFQHEMYYFLLLSGGPTNQIREKFMGDLRKYLEDNSPEEYHERLTPKYPLGCRRFIVDSGYVEALNRPNNDVNYDGIAEITEKGILTKRGQHFEFDVIIEATGFIVDDYPISIRGSHGKTIQQYNRERGGPTAYMGTTVPGFPNFFTISGMAMTIYEVSKAYAVDHYLSGPNTTSGHGSVVFTEEVQVNYIMQLLKPVINGLASSFEVTNEATDQWNDRIQDKLSKSVWSVCQSWYRVGHTGKNSSIWPGPLVEQWWKLRSPQWNHYTAVGAQKWRTRRRLGLLWNMVKIGGLVAVLAWGYTHYDGVVWAAMHSKDQLEVLLQGWGILD